MVRAVVVGLVLGAALSACSGQSTVIDRDGEVGDGASGGATGSGGRDGSGATGSGAIGGTIGSGGSASEPGSGAAAGTLVFARGGSAGTAVGESGSGPIGGAGSVGVCQYPDVAIELSEWIPWSVVEKAAWDRIRTGMVGDWYGIVSTPWTSPYVVTLSFDEALSYSAECAWSSNQCCVAFYYGTDDDSDLKRFELDRVTDDGHAFGELDVIYGMSGAYSESGYQGTLEDLELDATLDRMRFDFMYGGTYGPLHFELERRGEAPPR